MEDKCKEETVSLGLVWWSFCCINGSKWVFSDKCFFYPHNPTSHRHMHCTFCGTYRQRYAFILDGPALEFLTGHLPEVVWMKLLASFYFNGMKWNGMERNGMEWDRIEWNKSNGIDLNWTESNPVQSDPIQSNPIKLNQIQSNPTQSNPVQSSPVQSSPVQSNTIQSN